MRNGIGLAFVALLLASFALSACDELDARNDTARRDNLQYMHPEIAVHPEQGQ